MHSIAPVKLFLFGAACALAACASAGGSVDITTQASGSPYFSVSRPGVYKAGNGLEIAGRVCRRARTTLLSPPRVRVEHVSASGQIVEVSHASVSAIYRSADQPCAHYGAQVAWTLAEGDAVRACLDHGKPCPADPDNKAVVTAPASPS